MAKANRPPSASLNLPAMKTRWLFSGFPGALEREFRLENLRLSITLIRFTMIAGGVLMACFGLVNNLVLPTHSEGPWLPVFTVVRTAVIAPFAFICFLATFWKKYSRVAAPLLCLYALLFSFGISGRMAFSSRDDPAYFLYYAGLIIVCMGLNLGVHIRFLYAAGTGALIVSMYFIAALGFNRLLDTPLGTVFFVNNVFFLLATEVFGLMACFFSEYYRRNAFLLRKRIRVEEENARRKAFEKWKEAYRKFRDIKVKARKNKGKPAAAARGAKMPAATHAEQVKNDRLTDLIDTLGGRDGHGHVLDRIMGFVLEISGSRRGAIVIRDDHSGEALYIVRRGIKRRDTGFISGIVAETFDSRKPVVVNLAVGQGDAALQETARKSGVRSLLCFPVELKDTAIGACYLDQGQSDDQFSRESDDLIISLVTQVVLSVNEADWRDDGEPADIDEAGFKARCETLGLTPRERELARFVIRGFSKRKICSLLLISVNTLRSHLKSINSKAGVEKRSELLRLLTGDKPSSFQ
jgi:DNA-binding CsgD family transcriptional regulator